MLGEPDNKHQGSASDQASLSEEMTLQMRYKEETYRMQGRKYIVYSIQQVTIYAGVESMADLRRIFCTAGPHQVKVI